MLSSSRFVVAAHVMSLLAQKAKDGPVCSAVLAASVETNPVVIRRLMGKLEGHGLVKSESGRSGGFMLALPPHEISLACIYKAVEDEQVFRTHRSGESLECETSRAIMAALTPRLAAASAAMTESLRGVRLADIIPHKMQNAEDPKLTVA